MAERRYGYYQDGNVVRKIEYSAAPARPLEEPRRTAPAPKRAPQQRPSRTPARKTRRASRRAQDRSFLVELGHNAFLVFAGLLAAFMCMSYLKLSSDVKTEKNRVSALTATLEDQVSANEEYESRLDGAVDLDYIYSVATNELGMVYSEPGQTIYYSQNSDDYVVQYKNVPETN